MINDAHSPEIGDQFTCYAPNTRSKEFWTRRSAFLSEPRKYPGSFIRHFSIQASNTDDAKSVIFNEARLGKRL